MKVFVIGSINMDLVIRAPRIPEEGETLTGEGFMLNSGGKGANQAVALAKLGAQTYMVGCVGTGFGDELLTTLQGYGVRCDFVRKCDDLPSGVAMITVMDGDNRIVLDRGANGAVSCADVDKALLGAQAGDYLVVQLEIATEVVEYALQKAKALGVITVLNPAPAAKISAEAIANSDYFMPNQTEAGFYTGVTPSGIESAKQSAQALGAMGAKNVVITLGGEGALGLFNGAFYKAPACKAKVVDTTAAGDTFVGAFVTALSEGATQSAALAFACKAAAVTVTRRGAQQSIPLRREVDDIS